MCDFTIEQEWALRDYWVNEVSDSDIKFEELTCKDLLELWWLYEDEHPDWREELECEQSSPF